MGDFENQTDLEPDYPTRTADIHQALDISLPKVLIVEDDPASLKLMRSVMEFAGYEVIQTSSAEGGVRLAEMHKPVAVLMDISLPGMSGLAAVRMLKQNPQTQGIPVIAVTAHAMTKDKEAALAAGCDDYLSKPMSSRLLIETVARSRLKSSPSSVR
jgi:two-component system, cell cycle response regulator DivK